jgi:hypothetical protein
MGSWEPSQDVYWVPPEHLELMPEQNIIVLSTGKFDWMDGWMDGLLYF